MNLEKHALLILEDYPQVKKMPASVSGKYHVGETLYEHLETTATVMQHMCDEFKIDNTQRQVMVAGAWLHDIGNVAITVEGKIDEPGWTYFEKTNYSRQNALWGSHPILSVCIIKNYEIPRKDQICELVKSHMSHWAPNCPQPISFNQRLLCVADYVAAKGNGMFTWEKR